MRFKLTTSSSWEENTNDVLGELLGVDNKPAKFAGRIKSKEIKHSWFHTIELNSLEELLEFRRVCNSDISVGYIGSIPVLEIHDAYSE